MVAAVSDTDWRPMLERLREELESAQRSRIYGDLTLTVKFEDGEAVHEKVVTTKSRRLQKAT